MENAEENAELSAKQLIKLIREKFGGKSKSNQIFIDIHFISVGLYRYLTKTCHLYLPPIDEVPLCHLFDIMTGKKKAMYSNKCNHVQFSKFAEVSMAKLIPMM